MYGCWPVSICGERSGGLMLRYAIRRLITSLLTIFLVITLTFFLMQMVPGGPFLGENVNPEQKSFMDTIKKMFKK